MKSLDDVPVQALSEEVYGAKYQLKTKDGTLIDRDIHDTFRRVASALAEIELESLPSHVTSDGRKAHKREWFQQFLWALENGATPAGRIMSNLGADSWKPRTSTINCIVSDTVHDNMESIGSALMEEGLTLSAGCGIGYEFSTLRPKGALVSGVGAKTSGPLPFMDVFDSFCSTISSAGGRRGAQMATFSIRHPDVLDFIKAKRENGRFRKFNVSVLLDEEFMSAVSVNSEWKFAFPIRSDLTLEGDELIYLDWPIGDSEGFLFDDEGRVACKVYGSAPAGEIWDLIMKSAYDYSEPGVIMIDRINYWNNNWFCEDIRATNPCGEQPLPPNGACLLGSVNLTKFVTDPFTPEASFDFEKYRKVVGIFTRMLDNVVEANGLPLDKQIQEIEYKRRHGMGILGLGSTLCLLGKTYGTEDATAFVDQVMRLMVMEGWKQALDLGREKGVAPIMLDSFHIDERVLHKCPQLQEDGWNTHNYLDGKTLLFKYGNYMKRLRSLPDLTDEEKAIFDALEAEGGRFTHHTSIAPTGTIALAIGNNCSNGIEPSYAHSYNRNLTKEGKGTRQTQRVYSYELLAYKHLHNIGEDATFVLPDYFVGADDIPPERHLDMQVAAQKWVDSSISKTINVPTDIPFDKFKDVYIYGITNGVKGTTVFRFNPETLQGVLTQDKDLKNTLYKFIMDDGKELEVTGDSMIEYEGELHTAAMLYDAIKEGSYGKY